MAIRTELTLRLQNSPGMLARVCQVIANERINIVAMNLASPLVVRLVVDNPVHAAAVLREHQYQVEERDVIYTATSNDP
ncbi:MAG: ACT domain-containing protein, partial [Acidobacteria bacterium]|nr:ACT domain-containing protein [Acidobacteriota bacterium]